MKKRILCMLLALCAVITLLPTTALAADTKVITLKAPHTIAELNAKWATLKPVNTANPYVEEPQTSQMDGQPTLGRVSKQALTDGLNSLNFVRYMAGLGSDVSVVSDFQTSAQYAAVLLAYRDTTLTHTPDKPYGLNDDFFQKGYEGTFNSILYRQSGQNSAVTGLADSVRGFLDDRGENNKDVGHRFDVLDPLMTGTGMGMATSPSGMTYAAIWTGYGETLNGNGTKTTNYEAITWPTAGYQATDFFSSGVAWSVRLNSARYDLKKLGNVKVTVTGPNGTSTPSHHIGKYGSMIIFTPSGKMGAGEKYQVEITGLYRKDGQPATLKYTVEFFKLGEAGNSTEELLAADKIAVEQAVTNFKPLLCNYNTPEDVLNCIWAETRYVDSMEWVSAPVITKATDKKTGSFQGKLKCGLNGESFTYTVKMTIPKATRNDNVYRASAAAKAMKVSGATTAEDVVRAVSPVLDSGYTAAVSNFNIITAPTATEPGKLSYYLYTKDSEGKQLAKAGVVQMIPPLGRNYPGTGPAAPAMTAYPSTQTVELDGRKVTFQMYALKDANGNPTNYVKVRDLALALNGTKAQFSVDWNGAVNLVAGAAYTPNGSENKTPFSGERAYTLPTKPTSVNGSPSDLQAIVLTDANGGAYTYYQLRDLGRKLGFNVDWSSKRGVFIETNKPYGGK